MALAALTLLAAPAAALDEAQISQVSCGGLLLTQRGLSPGLPVEVVAHDARRGTELAEVDARADRAGLLRVQLTMRLQDVEQIVVEVEKPGSESVEYGEAAADLPRPCSAQPRDLPRFVSSTPPPPPSWKSSPEPPATATPVATGRVEGRPSRSRTPYLIGGLVLAAASALLRRRVISRR